MSVPPQSKIDRVHGHLRDLAADEPTRCVTASSTATSDPFSGGSVLDLDDAVGQPLPTTTIVGTPISSASLNFTPGETFRPVVEEHPTAGGLQLVGERSAAAKIALVLAGRDDVDVGRRDLARPDSPISS